MPHASDFRTGRHVVYNLNAHLVFVPKYRRKLITPRVFELLKQAWEGVCSDFGCELRESGYESDHVHLLVFYPPKVALSVLVNSLKGVSARRVRAANLPEIRSKLWGDHFWSPSYCAVSCGGAPLEIVKRYVEQQRGGGGLPPRPEGRGFRPRRTMKQDHPKYDDRWFYVKEVQTETDELYMVYRRSMTGALTPLGSVFATTPALARIRALELADGATPRAVALRSRIIVRNEDELPRHDTVAEPSMCNQGGRPGTRTRRVSEDPEAYPRETHTYPMAGAVGCPLCGAVMSDECDEECWSCGAVHDLAVRAECGGRR